MSLIKAEYLNNILPKLERLSNSKVPLGIMNDLLKSHLELQNEIEASSNLYPSVEEYDEVWWLNKYIILTLTTCINYTYEQELQPKIADASYLKN